MVSQNVAYLRDHGPATSEELPNKQVSAIDRRNGVWKFHPKVGLRGSHAVYYLRGVHGHEAVVRTWFEANEAKVERHSREQLVRKLRDVGPEFHDAIDAVLDEVVV